MTTTRIRLFGLLVCGLLALQGTSASAQAPACAPPLELFEHEPLLPKTLAALERGGPVVIVAIGGASTLGRAAALDSQSWPARLGAELQTRFPKAQVQVVNRGVARETAGQMTARFDRDVIAHKPVLVIWETGTNDAVRATDTDEFLEALQGGIAKLGAAVPEVMLMNPQFSRRSDAIVNFSRYTTILRGVADIAEVPLFPRHELMRHWADQKIFDYGVMGKEQRRELAIRVYACIGRAVADMIARPLPPGATAK